MPSGSKPQPGALNAHIAGALRAEVARQQISQADLAAAVGISQSQLSKYLAGKRSPNLDEFEAICAALGLSVLDVTAEAERRSVASMKGISDAERADLQAAVERHRPEGAQEAPRGRRTGS